MRRLANPSDKELLAFARELGALAGREDLLLLDCGAGIGAATVLTMLAADHVVLVTQPEIAALVDAYAMVKALAQPRVDTLAPLPGKKRNPTHAPPVASHAQPAVPVP